MCIRDRVPKTYLPNYGEFYEQRHFASGLGCLEYVDIEGKRVPFGTDKMCIRDRPEISFAEPAGKKQYQASGGR